MKKSKGQALVELALVLPLLLTLMSASIEFGWMYLQLYYINNAARIGARIGSAQADPGNNAAIGNAVTFALGPVTSAAHTITVSSPALIAQSNASRTPTHLLTVYVTVPYRTFTGLVDLTRISGIRTLRARSTFVIQPPP